MAAKTVDFVGKSADGLVQIELSKAPQNDSAISAVLKLDKSISPNGEHSTFPGRMLRKNGKLFAVEFLPGQLGVQVEADVDESTGAVVGLKRAVVNIGKNGETRSIEFKVGKARNYVAIAGAYAAVVGLAATGWWLVRGKKRKRR